ncbi:MAG: diguanylate cyclase [Desulfovibrio sp.]
MFTKEAKMLQQVEQSLQDDCCDAAALCAEMAGQYRRLLKKANRLVTTGDKMQLQLNAVNDELCRSRRKYKSIFNHVVEGIFRTDGTGRLVEVNPAMCSMLGYVDAEEFQQANANIQNLFVSHQAYAAFHAELTNIGEVRNCQVELVKGDGQRIWVEISIVQQSEAELDVFIDGMTRSCASEMSFVGVVSDITCRRGVMDEMRKLAMTDSLTGLWNRRFFEEQVQKKLSQCSGCGRGMALMMVDVDHFKQVNDNYGHDAGDKALCALAETLRSVVRNHDIVARFGGEEFVVFLPEAGLQSASHIAERIRAAIKDLRILCDNVVLKMTVSIGVAAVTPMVQPLDIALKFADEAMYCAKENGRDRVEICAGSVL